MTIEDVMTRDVITVSPETPIHRAAQLMVDHGVSGLPVVDQGQLVGILSEGDLILRQKSGANRPWWRAFFADGGRLAREYRKAVGTTAGDVMTRSVVTISPVFGIETAAAILINRNIRRLPVVRDGKLVGFVSRGDLVRALECGPAAVGGAASPPHPRGCECVTAGAARPASEERPPEAQPTPGRG